MSYYISSAYWQSFQLNKNAWVSSTPLPIAPIPKQGPKTGIFFQKLKGFRASILTQDFMALLKCLADELME